MRLALAVGGAAIAAVLLVSSWQGDAPRAMAAADIPAPCCAFKITYGVKRKLHGANWSGGVRDTAQVRRAFGWHFDMDDAILPPGQWKVTLKAIGNLVEPKAVIVDLVSPEEQPVTVFSRTGDFTFVPAKVPYGAIVSPEPFAGDVTIERVPVPATVTSKEYEDDDPALLRLRNGRYWLAWVGYKTRRLDELVLEGADEVFVSQSTDGAAWSRPLAITPPGDHFRVQLAEDAQGKLWAIYSAQKKMESGNFDLYAKTFDGVEWSAEQRLTSSPNPDIFHRVAATRDGTIYLTWMGYRGNPAQSDILLRVYQNGAWGAETNVSASAEDDWEPAVAADASGQAVIAWDVYRKSAKAAVASYDLLARRYKAAVPAGAVRVVSDTSYAEMRADVGMDGAGRAWIAWEEGPANWGKDTGWQSDKHRIRLRKGGAELYGPPNDPKMLYRRPRVAVLAGEQLQQPAGDRLSGALTEAHVAEPAGGGGRRGARVAADPAPDDSQRAVSGA